jgi:twinkle protein
MESEFLFHEPCPKCGSRDNAGRYSDGHLYCFGCQHYENGDGPVSNTRQSQSRDLIQEVSIRELPRRALTIETSDRYCYGIAELGGEPVHVATYRDRNGVAVMQKCRDKDKKFWVLGDTKWQGLFGMHLCRDGGRKIIITEGELDALSVSQAMGNKWPVVSLPHGAAAAKKAIAANLDWLLTYEEVSLCFDQDDAGRKAVEEVAALLPAGKCSVITLPLKDASDMLMADRTEELIRCLWDAKKYRPDGIVSAADVAHDALQPPRTDLSWCLPQLNAATYGRRYGELVGLGAGTGVGKTTFLTQQIAHDLTTGHAVAVFAFEQVPSETVKRVAGQIHGKRFHAPDGSWTTAELQAAIENLADKPFYLYDHFGSCDWSVIRTRIRYLAHAHGVRIFYLDHLTALAATVDDERKGLDVIMAELGGLVKELDCWLLFVSHLATPDGTPHEEGGRVTIRHFKGSRNIGSWSHFMFALERNQQSDDPTERNQTVFRVLKDRYLGDSTGLTIPLTYDKETGLMVEAPIAVIREATAKDMGF